VARPGLVVAGKPGELRGIWEGEAAALAIDPVRRRVWIVERTDLKVIDCVSEAEGRVLLRVPLPPELDSASVRIVVSGESAAIYALDKPLEHALLVEPARGASIPLLATTQNQVKGGSCDDGSVPLLITPPAYHQPARTTQQEHPVFSIGNGAEGEAPTGRVVPFPGDRFLVLDTRSDFTVTLIANVNEPGSPPLRSTQQAPSDWPRTVEGIGWDETGVVLASGDQRLLVTPKQGPELIELHPGLTTFRHGVNHVVNIFILTGEIVIGTAGVAVLVAGVAGLLALAPIWAPFVCFSK
jgi:hypothetical protein